MNAMLDQNRYRDADPVAAQYDKYLRDLAAAAKREVAAMREKGDLDHNWNHLRGTSGAKSYATGVFAGRKMTLRSKGVLALIASGVDTVAAISAHLGLVGDDGKNIISTHMRSGYIEVAAREPGRSRYRITDHGLAAIAHYGAVVPPRVVAKPEQRKRQPGDRMGTSRAVVLAIDAGAETNAQIQQATGLREVNVSASLRGLFERGFVNRHKVHGAKKSYTLTALGKAKAEEWRA